MRVGFRCAAQSSLPDIRPAVSCCLHRRPRSAVVTSGGGRRTSSRGVLASSFLGLCSLALLLAEGTSSDTIQRADCAKPKHGGLVSWTHATMTSAPISSRLLRETMPTVLRCLYHPFVHGIATGKLPLVSFKNYVGQDAFFLNAFADAYKSAGKLASQRGDAAGEKEFQTLAEGVADELKLHTAYAAKWSVDLSAVQPNDVTKAYCGFVADIAAGGTVDGSAAGQGVHGAGAKISHVCAALAPCMRLYAHLGQTLAKAGYAASEAAKKSNPYSEWVDTYATADFEGLASTLEALLDRYAESEEVTFDSLSPIFRRAMELELAFFGAQPNVNDVVVPTLSPALLAVDFDQTLTERDTTAVIVEAAIAALPSAAHQQQQQASFNSLAADFYSKYTAKVAENLAANPATPGAFDERALTKFCEAMAIFDSEALVPVVQGNFLKEASIGALRASVSRGAELHVISVNWSKDLILSTLQHKLASEAPLGVIAKDHLLPGSRLHSPDLVFDNDVSTGQLTVLGPPSTSLDKLDIMRELRSKAQGSIVYIGDSVTDLLALLAADVGIVVGSSGTLAKVAKTYGVEVRPLVGSLDTTADKGDRKHGVLFAAASWHDIILALHGSEALP